MFFLSQMLTLVRFDRGCGFFLGDGCSLEWRAIPGEPVASWLWGGRGRGGVSVIKNKLNNKVKG